MEAMKSACLGRRAIYACQTRNRARNRGRVILTVLFAALTAVSLSPRQSLAQSGNLWSAQRVLEYAGNECAALTPDTCRSVSSGPVTVANAGPASITLRCPSSFPHLVGWDTQQSEFLRVIVASAQPGENLQAGRLTERSTVDGLTVAVLNDAVANDQAVLGNLQLYIGCSQLPWNNTPFASERRGLPSVGVLEGASQEESGNGND